MRYASTVVRAITAAVLTAAAIAAACSRAKHDPPPAASTEYPAPRWPAYFKAPKSIDDLMPAARALVRNQSGLQGKGMGILQPGESVLIVTGDDSDPMVLDAIQRALTERKI